MSNFKPKNVSKTGAVNAAELKRGVALKAIIAYPQLVEPAERSNKYEAIFIVDKGEPQFPALQTLIGDHLEVVSGSRTFSGRFHNPLRSGDEEGQNGGYAMRNEAFRGKMFFRAKTQFKPKIFGGPTREVIDPSLVHGGDHVVVEVGAYGYNNQSAGVALSLNAIWRIKAGASRIEAGGNIGSSFQKFSAEDFDFDSIAETDDKPLF